MVKSLEPKRFSLLHGDPTTKNFLVREENGRYKLVGVIDASGKVGSLEYEIAKFYVFLRETSAINPKFDYKKAFEIFLNEYGEIDRDFFEFYKICATIERLIVLDKEDP